MADKQWFVTGADNIVGTFHTSSTEAWEAALKLFENTNHVNIHDRTGSVIYVIKAVDVEKHLPEPVMTSAEWERLRQWREDRGITY